MRQEWTLSTQEQKFSHRHCKPFHASGVNNEYRVSNLELSAALLPRCKCSKILMHRSSDRNLLSLSHHEQNKKYYLDRSNTKPRCWMRWKSSRLDLLTFQKCLATKHYWCSDWYSWWRLCISARCIHFWEEWRTWKRNPFRTVAIWSIQVKCFKHR